MLQDFIYVNKKAINNSLKNIKYVPALAFLILLTKILVLSLTNILYTVFPNMRFILGFLLYLVEVGVISLQITFLSDIVLNNNFRLDNLQSGFTRYLNVLLNTLFYIYLFDLLTVLFISPISNVLALICGIAVFIVMSVLYEEIYIGGNYGMYAIQNIFEFLKNNILNWIIPMIIFIFINLRFEIISRIAAFHVGFLLEAFIYSIILAFLYIFKGHLFEILYNSNYRKRQYERLF